MRERELKTINEWIKKVHLNPFFSSKKISFSNTQHYASITEPDPKMSTSVIYSLLNYNFCSA